MKRKYLENRVFAEINELVHFSFVSIGVYDVKKELSFRFLHLRFLPLL